MINRSSRSINLSPNIGLSIDVRVTQRPSLYQCSTYQPDQLISTNLPDTADRTKKRRNGVNISNLIPLTSSNAKSLDKALFGLTNSRSLRKNSGLLRYMVQNDKCDILAITETWLQNEQYLASEFCPDGYVLLREDRLGQRGGGVAVLCRAEYKPKRLRSRKYDSFESLMVSLSSAPNSMRIAVIYRPPGLSCATFINDFTSFLEDNALGGDSLLIIPRETEGYGFELVRLSVRPSVRPP